MDYSSHIRRVMLVFPPSTAIVGWEPMVTTPMGIAYLASAVREAGYEVACLDAVVEAPYQETAINETVSRFGLTYDQIMDKIAAWKPDLVGLSCIFSNQWPRDARVGQKDQSRGPRCNSGRRRRPSHFPVRVVHGGRAD